MDGDKLFRRIPTSKMSFNRFVLFGGVVLAIAPLVVPLTDIFCGFWFKLFTTLWCVYDPYQSLQCYVISIQRIAGTFYISMERRGNDTTGRTMLSARVGGCGKSSGTGGGFTPAASHASMRDW